MWNEMGNKYGILMCLDGLARVATAIGDYSRAAKLFGVARLPVKPIGVLFIQVDQKELEERRQPVKDELGEDMWRVEFERGGAMTQEEAVEYALEESPYNTR
jgi:hypothetical protein